MPGSVYSCGAIVSCVLHAFGVLVAVLITFILGVPGVVLQDHEDVLAFAFGKAVASSASNAPKPKTVAYVGRV